jgi:uncharacterized NAD(P)/FAD-binding protein YdhS
MDDDLARAARFNEEFGAGDAVIIGAGLTAIDTLLSLASQPAVGRIWMISRTGLLPQRHLPAAAPPHNMESQVQQWLSGPDGSCLARVRRGLLGIVRSKAFGDLNWRQVLDGLRPHTARIWQALSIRERQRFLARLRPYWEVHRHRMAPAIHSRVEALLGSGRAIAIGGQLQEAGATQRAVTLRYRARRQGSIETVRAAAVFNCTGPAPVRLPGSCPVLNSLHQQQLVTIDPLGLGLITSPGGEAISPFGRVQKDLLVIGALRKPGLWESTAIPELREQADRIARHLSGLAAGLSM